jgi:hypothetical protein
VALLLLLVALCTWLYVWPPTGSPHPDGPVVVLGGGEGDRLDEGLRIVGDDERLLVLSAGAGAEWEERGGSCDDPQVRCATPDPLNTAGEARMVEALAQEGGWGQVTVVTSEFHATRSRLLFARCVDAEVALVASDSGRSAAARAAGAHLEILGTLVAAVDTVTSC